MVYPKADRKTQQSGHCSSYSSFLNLLYTLDPQCTTTFLCLPKRVLHRCTLKLACNCEFSILNGIHIHTYNLFGHPSLNHFYNYFSTYLWNTQIECSWGPFINEVMQRRGLRQCVTLGREIYTGRRCTTPCAVVDQLQTPLHEKDTKKIKTVQ